MKINCPYCNSKVSINGEKVGLVIGGTGVITAFALIAGFGLGGWIGLASATLGGSAVARSLLQQKIILIQKSESLGGYFKCSECKKTIPIMNVLSQASASIKKKDITKS